MTQAVRVRIFYPADPLGVVPGGIDTFLRGLIKWAPEELAFSLVGMSTDPAARPLNHWQRCSLGGARTFDFLPIIANRQAGGRGALPLSLRFSAATRLQMAQVHGGFDVFDFHRIAPSLLFAHDGRPKNAYFHNDPQTLQLAASDNLWRHAPAVYQRLERQAVARFDRVWCVRDSGVQVLRQRYPALAQQIDFVSTWADADTFHPVSESRRQALRRACAQQHGLDPALPWVISVGRLDTQKDPALLLRALQRLHANDRPVQWLVIGDGVLRADLERRVAVAGLQQRVLFLGLQQPAAIADWLRVADVFALSSAYEGMPMALLEALGCGLPAAVTDVGEVRRVVRAGVNGAIAGTCSSKALARALLHVIDGADRMRGAPCTDAVAAYCPARVLAPVYESYCRLGHGTRALQVAADANRRRGDTAARPRRAAVGIPIDVLDRDAACARVIGWAHRRASRYVCFVNVHSSVHARRDERHRLALLASDLNAADGSPIAWTLAAKGRRTQQRVDGPSLMWQLCGEAAAHGIRIGLYGSTPDTVQALALRLRQQWPALQVGYQHAPPFRALSADEDAAVCAEIAGAGVGLLFVGLGCPKQEAWMAAHRGRVPAVMLGVGAAFDFHSGQMARAPQWMRSSGLEWLHRFGQQPRRLGQRYVLTNSMFLTKTAREITRTLVPAAGPRSAVTQPASFDDESLQTAVRRGSATVAAAEPRPVRRSVRVDPGPFEQLATHIDSRMPAMGLRPDGARMIGFIASAGGEGTSTVARAYVAASVGRLARRVLLLETGGDGRGSGLLQALAERRPLHTLLQPLHGGGVVASLGGPDAQRAGGALSARPELWAELRRHFDDIVLDLPSRRASALGLRLATLCDGVVLVLEGGRTRATVAQHLLGELRSVQANVLGTVLNKRRHYVPERIYGWL